MSSVLAAPSQVQSRTGYLKVSSATPSAKILYEPFPTTSLAVGTNGVIANDGNIIQFSTYAAAVTAMTNGATVYPIGATLTAGAFLRDMGKSVHIEVNPTGNATGAYRVATFTKVQLYTGANIQSSEGVGGKFSLPSAAAAVNNEYNTGYICTWTANPTQIPCDVSRVGY